MGETSRAETTADPRVSPLPRTGYCLQVTILPSTFRHLSFQADRSGLTIGAYRCRQLCRRLVHDCNVSETTGEKIRLRYAKTGTLRFLSHHDWMRSMERILRRANLPVRQTQGFHPGPRLVFALPLPLGAVALHDAMELELLSPHLDSDVLNRLQANSPDGLRFLKADVIPMKTTAMARRAVYAIAVPEQRRADVQDRIDAILTEPKCWVERMHPNPRRLNIRPFLRNLQLISGAVEFDLWVTPNGTARPDELAKLLDIHDLLDAGESVVRRDIEIHDELDGLPADFPPDGKPETEPLKHVLATVAKDTPNDATDATWGLSPNGPVVE
jgi:radical SAM-linked protein